jgi:hypothetical protein
MYWWTLAHGRLFCECLARWQHFVTVECVKCSGMCNLMKSGVLLDYHLTGIFFYVYSSCCYDCKALWRPEQHQSINILLWKLYSQVILLFQHMYFSNNLCCLICMQCKNADSYNMMTCYKVARYNGTHCLCILLYLPVPVLIPFIYDQ